MTADLGESKKDAKATSPNKVLAKMLDRLLASLVSGPSLNCRPHSSRQRVDLSALARFKDVEPTAALRSLLGEERKVKVVARVPMPRKAVDAHEDIALAERAEEDTVPVEGKDAKEKAQQQAWTDQTALLNKLRIIAEDARTYEQDTGVHVLNLGFPLLTLPPGMLGADRGASRKIIAPVAFVPVTLTVKRGATPSVEIECHADGVDLVSPNTGLLAWLEQQTGKPAFAELFADESGKDPWREICELVKRVCVLLEMEVPAEFSTEVAPSEDADEPPGTVKKKEAPDVRPGLRALKLVSAPRSDEDQSDAPRIIPACVVGLFPVANQGLLRDMQAMSSEEDDLIAGPVESFIRAGVSLERLPEEHPPEQTVKGKRVFADERLVTSADPCQARAVKLARQCKGLVIHGPPGTGKSQTITNIIGDHLSREQRVLLVCDKRTALDVVANRLTHMGLGKLCAVVHDPQRDQRELYKNVREQLEALPEVGTNAKAGGRLAKIDEELQELHAKLTEHWTALMTPPGNGGASFHELMGQWLGIETPAGFKIDEEALRDVRVDELEKREPAVREILRRGVDVQYPKNLWVAAAGGSVGEFTSRPMADVRAKFGAVMEAGRAADGTIDPTIPPFVTHVELEQQAGDRAALAERLQRVINEVDPAIAARWAKAPADGLQRAKTRLAEVEPALNAIRAQRLDADLATLARSEMPTAAAIAQQTAVLDEYLPYAGKWYGFLFFAKNKQAGEVTRKWGLPLGAGNAEKLKAFLGGLKTRMMVQAAYAETFANGTVVGLMQDDVLERAMASHGAVVQLLAHVKATPALATLYDAVAGVLTNPASAPAFISGLQRSRGRANALIALERAMQDSRLYADGWREAFNADRRAGKTSVELLGELEQRLPNLEGVLRAREGLASLPAALKGTVTSLLAQSVSPDDGVALLRKSILAGEITRRLRSDAVLQSVDATAIESAFERYRKLDEQKKELMRDAILHQWTTKQKERLLAQTGSRLNAAGADLKRRLTLRGERAMRLRQVIAVGQRQYGEGGDEEALADAREDVGAASAAAGTRTAAEAAPSSSTPTASPDPLFDVCPIWMASPETVAQIFPRAPMFDVVIFDEASQCRLEEALPVLTRGQRVVIAGDPKQLPPTRFFESAVAISEEEEIENEQQLFEAQQGEVEDLLAAALNLEIEQCYLDVHYRSRNADLIEFSNEHFYGSRLQAIPGHPSNRTRYAPLTLYRVDGVYDKRMNEAEATKVCEIVRDLLKRAKPPSIGIACFNLQQRDLIVEMLDELAVEDGEFGRKLAEARVRTGSGSFEGLFVKNLENVQGDERDHILISTTYGPDVKGRFYQRFGPLGRAGGGRRLNVLITRARQEVHVITSIPREVYRALPPVPTGQTPGGGWLLFAYLKYAEELAEAYAAESAPSPGTPSPTPRASEEGPCAVKVRPSKYRTPFGEALAQRLAKEKQVGSDVHWGNDGFAVDLALHHPRSPEDVTVGILVDGSRFTQAEDPVEWDIFRTAIHESQGWKLHRLWTPHFFRDPDGCLQAILTEAESEAVRQEKKGLLRAGPPVV